MTSWLLIMSIYTGDYNSQIIQVETGSKEQCTQLEKVYRKVTSNIQTSSESVQSICLKHDGTLKVLNK